MIEDLVSAFVQAWLLALIALLIGRFVGQGPKRFPAFPVAKALVFLQVWGVTFLAQLAFSYAGNVMALKEHTQAGLAEFLLPLVFGAIYAHLTLRRIAAAS